MSDKDAGAAWNSLLEGASKEYISEMLLAQLKEGRKLKVELAEANTKVEQLVEDLHAVSADYADAKLEADCLKERADAYLTAVSNLSVENSELWDRVRSARRQALEDAARAECSYCSNYGRCAAWVAIPTVYSKSSKEYWHSHKAGLPPSQLCSASAIRALIDKESR